MAHSTVGNDVPQVATTTIDRISGLPDEMIHHILSFLSLKNAVGTSILSNRWRHFWTFNPNLDFRQDFPKDIAIINHYIHLHNCPNIDILAIRLEAEEDLSTHVEAWIRFASTRGARKLFLDIYSDSTMDLPDVFYHHTAVTEFQLCCFTINLPLEFKGFPFLKVLKLCKVKISDQNVSDLLSTCPLEELGMALCLDLVNLNISAPNNNLGLKLLLVWWCDHLENLVVDAPNLLGIVFQGKITTNITIISAPRLHIADVKVTGLFSPADVREWKPFVRTMNHVNSLRVQSWFFQFVFAEFCVLRTLETMFANLYEFRWSGFLVSRYEVLALATFLGNCPVLETLKIMCCPISESLPGSYHRYFRVLEELTGPLEGAVTSHFRTEDKKPYLQHLDYVLPQLKAIEFVSFSGTKKEMDLVRFLLGKAPVLDSLVFTSISDNKTDSHIPNWKLQKRLDCLPKASVLVKIVFS